MAGTKAMSWKLVGRDSSCKRQARVNSRSDHPCASRSSSNRLKMRNERWRSWRWLRCGRRDLSNIRSLARMLAMRIRVSRYPESNRRLPILYGSMVVSVRMASSGVGILLGRSCLSCFLFGCEVWLELNWD